jgi:hypothetical protein
MLEVDLYELSAFYHGSGTDAGDPPSTSSSSSALSSSPLSAAQTAAQACPCEAVLQALKAGELDRLRHTVRKGGLGRDLYPWLGTEPMFRLQVRLAAVGSDREYS